MVFDLRRIFKSEGSQQKIDCRLDFSEYEYNHNKPFPKPVHVEGTIENNSSNVIFNAKISTKTSFMCDRCLETFESDYSQAFEHVLVIKPLVQNDDYILLENYKLDLDELVMSDILLSMPYRILCDEECMGLCPQCGHNLNISECECENIN